MALRDRQVGKVSTALLLAIIALPLSVAAFVMLYADWNLTVPTTKDQTSEFWAALLICAVLPLICASTVFVVRDFVRRRSGKQVVAVISLLVPTALLMGITLSPRFLHVWRMQLTARTWHWRHGSSTRVGHYEVPVPGHCFATDIPYGVQWSVQPLASSMDPKFRPVLLCSFQKPVRMSTWNTGNQYNAHLARRKS